ncbi:MAG TPA: MFS transporter [Thermodesulfobacteriota bacterium]|nr:MFS transporter [Thermodesulfobacteriota bacterium]
MRVRQDIAAEENIKARRPGVRNVLIITAANFMAVACMGLSFGFLGPSLPSLREYLDLDLGKAGLFTAGIQFGYGLMGTIGGILSDVFPGGRVLLLGCLCLGCGAIFFGLMPSYGLNLGLVTVIGAGGGLILSSSHTILVGLHPARKGSILNVHHIFSATGSLIAPLIIGALIAGGIKWQYAYETLGFLAVALAIFFAAVKTPEAEGRPRFRIGLVGVLARQRNFLLLVLVDFLMMGTQFSVIYLSVTFLKEAKGFPVVAASAVLSAFFVLMILGRLSCGWAARRASNSGILLILLPATAAVTCLAWRGDGWISAAGVMLTGLACSGIFPCLLALAGGIYRDAAGTSMGFIGMMSGFGGMFFCWLTAVVSQKTDAAFGFIVPVLAAALAAALFAIQYRSLMSAETGTPVQLAPGTGKAG